MGYPWVILIRTSGYSGYPVQDFQAPEGYIPSSGNGDIPGMSIGCPRTFEDYFGISQHPVRISSGRPRDILLM